MPSDYYLPLLLECTLWKIKSLRFWFVCLFWRLSAASSMVPGRSSARVKIHFKVVNRQAVWNEDVPEMKLGSLAHSPQCNAQMQCFTPHACPGQSIFILSCGQMVYHSPNQFFFFLCVNSSNIYCQALL